MHRWSNAWQYSIQLSVLATGCSCDSDLELLMMTSGSGVCQTSLDTLLQGCKSMIRGLPQGSHCTLLPIDLAGSGVDPSKRPPGRGR